MLSLVFTGSALATTAIGTLIPILGDADELRTRFGTYLLAAGAIGEFGPILLITIAFSTQSALASGAILAAFVALAVMAGIVAVRSFHRGWHVLERTLETSSQLPTRLVVTIVFALVTLAASLGLDLLLGGFVAGIILRLALQGREVEVLESKLTAVGYGFLIPFFFVTTGIKLDLQALFDRPERLLELPLFLVLFLVVRGAPALVLYRRVLDARDRARARVLLGDRAAARRRDHDDRGRGGPHALLDGRVARRGRRPLDGDLPARRAAPAAGAAYGVNVAV